MNNTSKADIAAKLRAMREAWPPRTRTITDVAAEVLLNLLVPEPDWDA